jgi:hypothetical protein
MTNGELLMVNEKDVDRGWAVVGAVTPVVFGVVLRMKGRGRTGLVVLLLLLHLVLEAPLLAAQEGGVPLTVRLRDETGAAVAGEPVVLERLPEEAAVSPACTTDDAGECAWRVGRGLYQLLFAHPLDPVSAVAVAEGGLRGLGVTVGEGPITYTFTLAGDDHVYFDAAPDAAVPVPIIPTLDHHHGGGMAPQATLTPPPPLSTTVPVTTLLSTETTETGTVVVENGEGDRLLRLLAFPAAGLALGVALHLWSRRRQTTVKAPMSGKETAVKPVLPDNPEPPHTGAHSAFRTPHSPFRTPHSAFPNPEDYDA